MFLLCIRKPYWALCTLSNLIIALNLGGSYYYPFIKDTQSEAHILILMPTGFN